MKRNIILTLILLALALGAKAQNSSLAYLSQRMPQRNSVNPAFFPSRNNFYIMLPGVQLDFTNPLAYSDLVQYTPGDSISRVDLNHVLDRLAEDGRFGLSTDLSVVGLGIKLGDLHLTAEVGAHLSAQIGLPTGLAEFLNNGNTQNLGPDNKVTIAGGDLLNANIYGHAGLGIGMQIIKGLTVGARFKLYDGYFNLNTESTLLTLYTSENFDEMAANVNYRLRAAGCYPFKEMLVTDASGATRLEPSMDICKLNYLPNNWGYGLDLGVHWEGRLIDLSASVQDVGASVHWRDNTFQIAPEGGASSFTFSGVDLNQCVDENGTFNLDIVQPMIDTFLTGLNPVFSEGQDYTTYMPAKLNASALFTPFKWLRAGVMYHGEFDSKKNLGQVEWDDLDYHRYRGRTSVVAQVNLFDWIEVMGNMAVVDDGANISWFNPGLGVNLSLLKTLQIYALMDYISNIYLVDAKSFNVSVGLNLTLINKRFFKK